jgi:hypothetical protein
MMAEFKPATSDHLSSFIPHIAVPNFVESLDGGRAGGLAGRRAGWSPAAADRCSHPSRDSAAVFSAAACPAPSCPAPPFLLCLYAALQTPQTCRHCPASTLE